MAPTPEDITQRLDEKITQIQEEIGAMSQGDALAQIWEEGDRLEGLLKQHPLKIMLAANIGFGKTTATRIIGHFAKIPELYEKPDENPVLPLYYNDMATYGERLQIHLINERLYELVFNLLQYPNQSLVSDRTPYEDTLIFCEVLYNARDKKGQRLMSQESKEFCQDYLLNKMKQLERRYPVDLSPDLIVFLKGNLDTGWKRVHNRDREMEIREDAGKGVGLTREFYAILHQEYLSFPERLGQYYKGPILSLPQDTVEVADATNSKGQLYLVRSVKEALELIFS